MFRPFFPVAPLPECDLDQHPERKPPMKLVPIGEPVHEQIASAGRYVQELSRRLILGLAGQEEAFLQRHVTGEMIQTGSHVRVHYPWRSRQENGAEVNECTVTLVPVGAPGLPEEEAKRLYPWTTLSYSVRGVSSITSGGETKA